jgi:hypothetical protein
VPETPLWLLSISAFSAVMLLLGTLAVAIFILTLMFPPPTSVAAADPAPVSDDPSPYLAAIEVAVARQWPGARVRRVEAHHEGDPR